MVMGGELSVVGFFRLGQVGGGLLEMRRECLGTGTMIFREIATLAMVKWNAKSFMACFTLAEARSCFSY